MSHKELSFIIPAFNEEYHLGGVLDSIRENAGEHVQYEIIVVDNGSRDRTVEIAEKKGDLCLHAPGCTISSLRNLGALEANADIFVFLDADVYLGKDWSRHIRAVMDKVLSEPHIITGSIYGISEENNWIEMVWFAPRTTRKEINYINGGHLIIHKSLFSRVGGFDRELETGEDYDICARARKMGARIENDPELKVVHAGYPKNIRGFFARERWHARGDYKSFKTLTASKPALLSLANLCMVVSCSIAMPISAQAWFMFPCIYVLFLTCVSLMASIHRCCGKPDSGFIGAVFLYMVYFTARTVSLAERAIHYIVEREPFSVLRKF